MCYAIQMMLEEEREKGIEKGVLLHAYRMVSRGRETVEEALEDVEFVLSEDDFLAGMQAAGFSLP